MKKKISFSNKVIIALIAGIICGLLFGDICAYLKPLGDIFIKIMQITLIPYIVVSLLHGIGGLSKEEAKSIAIKGSLVLVSFWIMTIGIFFILQLTFPVIESASFYSSVTYSDQSTNYMNLFIPSNPFASLADSSIPAIVLFCVLLGIAFINVKSENKTAVLNVMNLLCKSIERITKMLITIVPYGTFVLTAYTAGTITGSKVEILAIYIIGYIICSLFVIILVIPMIISSVTKFTYYDILTEVKGILIFTFVTGNLFIALPLIVESVKNICEKYENQDESVSAQAESLIPIYFSLPGLGKLSVMFFILFIAWYYNHPLTIFKQIQLGSVGLFSLFGSPYLALPFLLKFLQLPSDAFNLYLASSQIIRKFALMLDVLGLFSCTLICISLSTNFFKLRTGKLVKSIILIIIVFIILLSGLRFAFSKAFSNLYTGNTQLQGMVLPKIHTGKNYSDIISTKVYKKIPEHLLNTNPAINGEGNTLSQILKRKVLRVGYNSNCMPFNFFNKKGDLVGYDIQMAYELAMFLKCPNIEFIPIQYNSLEKVLNDRTCDIVMASIDITPERISRMMFSTSYMTQALAMIVKDYQKEGFSKVEEINKIKGLKIAILKGNAFIPLVQIMFPNAKIIEINNLNAFFNTDIADALIDTAEEGFVWTLLYPDYDVSMFSPNDNLKLPLAYPIAQNGGESFRLFLNAWVDLKKTDGSLSKYYKYWIQGEKETGNLPKRWSVIRNVFHLTK